MIGYSALMACNSPAAFKTYATTVLDDNKGRLGL